MENEKIGFIAKIDAKAIEKGNKINLLWQFTKYFVISLLTTGVQLALVNILFIALKDFKAPLPYFLDLIFSPSSVGEGNNNWGYVLPFLVSNLVANTIGYFLNRSKTFKSDAPWWHFVIYIGLLVTLILFSTWLQGVVVNAMIKSDIYFFIVSAPTIAGLVAGSIQFLSLFPIQKYVLLREKK